MSKFIIKKTTTGQYRFDLKAGNGEVILNSENYETKSACENGVDSVKRNADKDERYERETSTSGKPFFTLKASNGQVIGTSELYESTAARDNGIESVKKNAANAETVEAIDN